MEKCDSNRGKKQIYRNSSKNLKNEMKDDNNVKKVVNSEVQHNTKNNKSYKHRRRDRARRKDGSDGVKLVLRLLPPNLTKKDFVETLVPQTGEFTECAVVDWYYMQGHYSPKIYTEPQYSRCYFIFETVGQLNSFSKKVEQVRFTDDRNTSPATIQVSPYVRRPVGESKRVSGSLQGTIETDDLFKTFLNSLKLLEEKGSEYSFENISILRHMEKQLAKQKSVESEIKKRTEVALMELTGRKEQKTKGEKKAEKKSEKKSKEEKKNKKKKKPEDSQIGEGENGIVTKEKSKRKRSKKTKKTKNTEEGATDSASSKNNNVVILEAAGKKELRRRKKLKEASLKNESVKQRHTAQRQQDDPKPAKVKMLKKKDEDSLDSK